MTNAEILTAVILKWGEPIIPALLAGGANSETSGMMLPVERFLKNWGIVGQNWSARKEINSLVAIGGKDVLRPFVFSMISKIPDEMIPSVAHNYVDAAIKEGKIELFGRIDIEKEDLEELKKYLDCNLPYKKGNEYEVVVPEE